jgi:hypothetical protein
MFIRVSNFVSLPLNFNYHLAFVVVVFFVIFFVLAFPALLFVCCQPYNFRVVP